MSGDQNKSILLTESSEDITTALSRIGWLFVIARNSAFTYKGRAVDVRKSAASWTSVTSWRADARAGSRVRITCQLIEAPTAAMYGPIGSKATCRYL